MRLSRFTASADAQTFRFTLRKGVKFANGDPVTADGGTDSAKAASADKAEKFNAGSAGSGPYTLTSFSTTSQVSLTAL